MHRWRFSYFDNNIGRTLIIKTYLIINFQICIMVSRKKQDPTADDMPLHTADMTFTSDTANQGQMTTYER